MIHSENTTVLSAWQTADIRGFEQQSGTTRLEIMNECRYLVVGGGIAGVTCAEQASCP
jgi:heterodisulfide reductase subunit A-like polyferredoxin